MTKFKSGDVLKVKTFKEIQKVSNIDSDGDLRLEYDDNCGTAYFFKSMKTLCSTVFVCNDADDGGFITLYGWQLHPKWLKKASDKEAKKCKKDQKVLGELLVTFANTNYARIKPEKELRKTGVVDTNGDIDVRNFTLEDEVIAAAGAVVKVIKVDFSDHSVQIMLPESGGNSWVVPEWLTPLSRAEADALDRENAARKASLTAKQRAAIKAVKDGIWGCQTKSVRRLVAVLAEFPMEAYDDFDS